MRRNTRAINIFGSKVSNAHRYPAPRHRRIIEPFAGGAGYSLLYHTHDVVLCDVRPEIVNVWRYLINTSPEEILRLPLLKPEQLVSDLECSDGGRLLISWCCNQTAGPRKKLSSWGVYAVERNAASYWCQSRRRQAAEIAGRVKHWTVQLRDIDELYDGYWRQLQESKWPLGYVQATWFIDPPYACAPKQYGTKPLDYTRLASWCRSLPGQVIVCERAGAAWLPFMPLYEALTAKRFGCGRGRCSEAVWTND